MSTNMLTITLPNGLTQRSTNEFLRKAGKGGETDEVDEMGEASEIGPQAWVGRTSMGLDFKVFKNINR